MNTTTILLVDDLEENLIAMSALLRAPEVRVLMARSGAEALEILLVNEVALALVDVRMPDMDGFELAELMRGSERTKYVPIVFITAGAHDRQRQFKGFNSGAVDFLYKPVEPHVLTGKVAVFVELFRQKKAFSRVSALQNAILNSANFSSIATDANGVIQIFNVGAEHMLGYTAAEVVNRLSPFEFYDAQESIARAAALSLEFGTEVAPGLDALIFKASRGIEDYYELTKIRKDGSRFPAVVSVTPLRDPRREIIGYLLISTDNTALKQASQYARSLLEASLDPLVTISPDGKITDVNDGSIKATGVAREKLIGTDFSDYFTEPDKAREGYLQVFAKGSVIDYPLTIRHCSGRLTDVLYNASVYKDVRGKVLGVFAAARDITARKQAEAALLRAGALQSAIFNSANFSSIATDANGVIQIFNVGAERMLGYTAIEVMNKITPADISDPQEVVERARVLSLELDTVITPGFEALVFKASRGIEDIYELTYIRKDGSRFPAVVSVTALRDAQDAIIGYLLIGTDNTARKQVEDERREIEKLLQQKNTELEAAIAVADKANRAKSDFLSSMSHELRTPLNAILGFAQLIQAAAPPPTSNQQRSVDQILKAGWYLLELINEILDLALIESDRATLSQEPVSLHEVFLECQGMVETQAKMRGLGMTFPHLEKHCFVFADRIRIKQVLVNLLSNAIKYNRVDGSVSVESALCPPHSIRIGVRDTGYGLTPEQLAQLFEPFNRLGREGGTEEGTGIGLVVTKRLVELMGGRIGVDSVVGVGSVFWFELELTTATLPQTVDAEHAKLTPLPSPADTLVHTLLYVEDNPANLNLVEQLIARRADLNLLTATNGHAGIALARTWLPKVILMDINLPGMSGIDAMRILREEPLTAHIPVIAVSASASKIDIANGIKAGFFSYVTKPIRFPDFMKSLDEALEHSKGLKESPSKAKQQHIGSI